MRVLFTCFLMLALSQDAAPQEKKRQEISFRDWIYRQLGINPKVLQAHASTMGGDQRRHGARVMVVSLKNETESTLWNCEDCWAPAIVNERDVIVVKADGLWLTESKRLVVKAEGVIDILGRLGKTPHRLRCNRILPATCRPAPASCGLQI